MRVLFLLKQINLPRQYEEKKENDFLFLLHQEVLHVAHSAFEACESF